MKIKRVFDILAQAEKKYAKKDDYIAEKVNGKWVKFNAKSYREYADNFSLGLLALGIKKGDKIITVSNNRVAWNFADMGMSQIGAVHTPIYPTLSDEESEYVIKHSDAKIVIASSKALFQKLEPIAKKIKAVKHIFTFDEIENARNWSEVLELGKQNKEKYEKELESRKKEITENDLATIIYTSGTTGLSKGVMLTHKNLMSNVRETADLGFLKETDRVLSFLPLCHVFERMVNYTYQYLGVSLFYAESLATIGENLKELKINGFVAVPRVLESIFDKIIAAGKKLTGAKKAVFFHAVYLAQNYKLHEKNSAVYKVQHKLADRLVYSKWREAVGGQINFIAAGGAALQPRIERIFWAAGIPIYQGYGLSETSPIIAVNYGGKNVMENTKFTTVGKTLKNLDVKISEEGEIICKGPNVMKGYYKAPEMTAEVIDKDGYFHTGDIGILDEEGYLSITDRMKEIFKMSSGKYIAPQKIENILKESVFIEQAMVVGENEKFASAIIAPNFSFLQDWCYKNKIEFNNNQELLKIKEVSQRFQKEILKANKQLGQTEHIKKFRLVRDEWTTASGALSPTLKLKRRFLLEKYKKLIESIYK